MTNKTLFELRKDAIEANKTSKNTYTMFPIGTRVKIIAPIQDFRFFNGETGTVVMNSENYLGIKVKFDAPQLYEDKSILKEFGFEPEDLIIIT